MQKALTVLLNFKPVKMKKIFEIMTVVFTESKMWNIIGKLQLLRNTIKQ